MDDIVFIGEWVKDRVLGSGSFGIVVLWKHKKTDEKLAIKTCKWGDELTEKHKERWTKEVEMLQNCGNLNIVATKELPTEFVQGLVPANPSKLPILCMEYCSGGDLRQLLNKPECSSGLKEFQVRQILSDLRNAMNFLHQNKITHRDLKPENIVMSVQGLPGQSVGSMHQQSKVIYKLIDLGYAKEIDSNSVCASFVGTLQYLAPELLYSKTYSNSVDYWSLGLLAFEIICGKRPFLPYMAPVQWMPHVKKKVHENISVYETYHGDIEYSNEIFPEVFISTPFKIQIEEWLRVALEWDPKLRGRCAQSRVTFKIPTEQKEANSNIVIFDMLEKILSKKFIKVFSVATAFQLAYEIDGNTTVASLKSWIFRDTGIPLQEQILISHMDFSKPNDEDLALKYWNENCNTMFSFFSKKYVVKSTVEPVVPKSVQRCLEHPKALYNYKNSDNLYKNSLYFVMSQMEMYDSLINGLFARAESLKFEGNQLLLKHNSVDKCIGNLLAKEQIVKKITDIGKKHINNLRETDTGTNMLGGFDQIFQKSDDLTDNVGILQTAWSKLTVRLQSATRRCNESISGDVKNFVAKYNFQSNYVNAFKAYISHKKEMFITENKGKEKRCDDIVKVCYDTLKIRSKIVAEINIQTFVLKLMDLSTELSKISEIVATANDNTEKLNSGLDVALDELTNCTWTTISLALRDAGNLSDVPYSVVSFDKKSFKIGEPVSNHFMKPASSNNIDENEELKSLITESVMIRQSQKQYAQQLNAQMKTLNKTAFDFSFLNN